MFAPTFHSLLAPGAAGCPHSVCGLTVLPGLTEDPRSVALTAVLVNPLLNSCSFRSLGWQKCQTAAHAQSCISFFFFFLFHSNFVSLSIQGALSDGVTSVEWDGVKACQGWCLWGSRGLAPKGKCPFSRGALQKLLLLYGCLQLGRNYPHAWGGRIWK